MCWRLGISQFGRSSSHLSLVLGFMAAVIFIYLRKKKRDLEEAKDGVPRINATHDIRSPLTLIMEPLKKLKRSDWEMLRNIRRRILIPSTETPQRLLTLVNQILDKRRLDKHQMNLLVQGNQPGGVFAGIGFALHLQCQPAWY